MKKNIWKKITAAALSIALTVSSAAYAESISTSYGNIQPAALTELYEKQKSVNLQTGEVSENDEAAAKDDAANDDRHVVGETANLTGGLEGSESVQATMPFSWKEFLLSAFKEAANTVVDTLEKDGTLDNILTSEGYDNLRKLIDGVTDANVWKETLPLIGEGAVLMVFQAVVSLMTPFITPVFAFLDSIGINSDVIVELASLIPEEFQPLIKDALSISGILGITDPNTTVFPLLNNKINSTWAIYLYMAGNDLETRNWAGTHDLKEIMQTSLPKNVKVVIEGGGAQYWHSEYMDAKYQNRCVYDSDGMHVISQTPRQNMGEQQTLESFLDWCTTDYPADNTILVFWGHGGATDGVCLDENYEDDRLTLTEIKGAVDNVFGTDRTEPVFDVVGFDACLMAAVETANVCSEFASYLAASEESEPGNGWAYHSILSQIAATPEMTMEQLGKLMCSSFLFNNVIKETDSETTFSYVDLEKAHALIEAYENLGKAILERYREDPSIKEKVFHIAADAETYAATLGMRSTNQIDLGDFADYLRSLFPEESEKVLDELMNCVIYMDNGSKRDHSRGLSCTFPFNLSGKSLTRYKEVAASPSFLTYFEEAGYFKQEDSSESSTETKAA